MAAAPKRREFPFGRSFFVQRLLLFFAFAGLVLAVLGLQFSTPGSWIAAFAVLFAVYIVVWGISPLLTTHWITTTRLLLRQGWYFRAVIPMREIESVSKFQGNAPLGLRAPIGQRRLFATGSKVGLLALKLRNPRRFWAVLGAEVDEIVFDVESPDAFLEAFSGRQSSLAPVEPKRADPYLRD
jgi:hypothetical protein